MPRPHENRVAAIDCPHCGMSRPYDWFVPSSDACWRCRGINPELKDNRRKEDIGTAKREELRRKRAAGERF